MSSTPSQTTPSEHTPATGQVAVARMSELGTLLEELEQVSSTTGPSAPPAMLESENELAQVRLGIAASLFVALRCKHSPVASHALRVGLMSSAWASEMGLPDKQRDAIEVAALLHDVGMIGVPDRILMKPGPLDADELRAIGQSHQMSLEILRGACADEETLDLVEHVGAWYDGSRGRHRFSGEKIPLGARLITIAEAFDSMTTDQVFRPARSIEWATVELFEFAGTQFDPQLVKRFAEFCMGNQTVARQNVSNRWLHSLDPEAANSHWKLSRARALPKSTDGESLFRKRLLDNMHDAAVFIDAALRVTFWNHGAERLTGISNSSVKQRQWSSGLLSMLNEKGEPLDSDDCPVIAAVNSGVQSLRRLTISGRTGEPKAVDTHTIAVVSDDGTNLGAILLLHDASSETSLEKRCQNLHEKATKDPMTQVANRAEFDRALEMFVNAHKQHRVPCSLIICDLDEFKQINDTYGHQAGDEVIKLLATLLKNSCRPGDFAARYGGEEFVMLCADCDNATVARRAEQIRKVLANTAQPALNGRAVTASFGVTEIQPGDTPETMLRRADRGLLMAKAKGRNVVMQLGVGSGGEEETGADTSSKRGTVIEQVLVTPVPISVAIEKLRGFVADHQAEVESADGDTVKLRIAFQIQKARRRADRLVQFSVDLRLEEELVRRSAASDVGLDTISRTRISVGISPRTNRDRRRPDAKTCGQQVLASLRSYLMATPEE
jgi:diguanylate cyclase (GGDEF)-like protein